MASNFNRMMEQGRALFLTYDQEDMIRHFSLRHDGENLYFSILGEPAALGRTTGIITCGGKRVGEALSLTVYDILSRAKDAPVLAGKWVSITTLGDFIAVGHTRSLGSDPRIRELAGRGGTIRALCEGWGGTPREQGDVSYVLPLFDFFPVWLQFWDADEDFPPQLGCLWDANTLSFLHYETTWYVLGYLRGEIERAVREGMA